MLTRRIIYLTICLLIASIYEVSYSQDTVPGINLIDSEDLESHVSFLASPYLKGRSNGEPELEIALNYIVSQARRIGLKPANGQNYLQSYCINRSFNSLHMPQYSLISCGNLKNSGTSGKDEFVLHNVAAWIEGCDPVLKSEYVVFSCHADHIGTRDDSICAGADDDASGCAALLEIAEAFRNQDKKPLRSVVFLWLTGEEIGLFGSQAYVNDPLFPLENTIADLNMDMIGRVKGVADSTSETPVSGPLGVFIIADDQSRELMSIADEADKRSILAFDYSLSGRYNHLNLFARSDHFNFVKKDIPILFFTTGLHSDYHTPGDVIEKLDFGKLELVARSAFEIGWEIANRKSRLIVDNPFTKRP
jgi:hypothetical protein